MEVQEKKRLKEIESRLHPKNNKDFETLYNGLESKTRFSFQKVGGFKKLKELITWTIQSLQDWQL